MDNKNNVLKQILNFDNREELKKFIAEHESDIYTGKNVDGQEVRVRLQKNEGMLVETLNNKGWWEWNEYDECGFVVGQGVSPGAEIEKKLENRNKMK